jgi:hypothetical protein
MLLLFVSLGIFALLSLAFMGAMVVESRRAERKRCAFLRSLHAPAAVGTYGWHVRLAYLAGSVVLLLVFFLLPFALGLLLPADA